MRLSRELGELKSNLKLICEIAEDTHETSIDYAIISSIDAKYRVRSINMGIRSLKKQMVTMMTYILFFLGSLVALAQLDDSRYLHLSIVTFILGLCSIFYTCYKGVLLIKHYYYLPKFIKYHKVFLAQLRLLNEYINFK